MTALTDIQPTCGTVRILAGPPFYCVSDTYSPDGSHIHYMRKLTDDGTPAG